jgi:hypothetical protein
MAQDGGIHPSSQLCGETKTGGLWSRLAQA